MILILVASILGIAYMAKDEIGDSIETKLDSWTTYDALYQKYGVKWNVPWTWLKAIALNESDNGRAVSVARGIAYPDDIESSKSSDGKSWGIMQVTLSTAGDMDPSVTPQKLNNPEYSINLGAQYLGKFLPTYFSRSDSRYLEWIVKSYNQGPGNTLKEKKGEISGYAQSYWERFQRNLKRVQESL